MSKDRLASDAVGRIRSCAEDPDAEYVSLSRRECIALGAHLDRAQRDLHGGQTPEDGMATEHQPIEGKATR